MGCLVLCFVATASQVDRVTELLNTSPLKPVDLTSVSIALQQCYGVRSIADELFYRAEVIEICYRDARCQRAPSDGSTMCRCDQLMRSQTTAAEAVRVQSASYLQLTTREAAWYILSVVSVCLSVCQTISLERVDAGSSFSHMRYISKECGSSSYKVIGSRSRSQEPHGSKIPVPVM